MDLSLIFPFLCDTEVCIYADDMTIFAGHSNVNKAQNKIEENASAFPGGPLTTK